MDIICNGQVIEFMVCLLVCADLYDAWMTKKYGYFVSLIVLLCLSSIFYLLTSFVDPGYLPKMDPLTVSMSPTSSTKVRAFNNL